MSGVLAAGVALLALVGFTADVPFNDDGTSYLVLQISLALVAILLCILAMRGQRALRIPLTVAAIAGAGIILSMIYAVTKEPASEFLSIIVKYLAGFVMLLAALIAVTMHVVKHAWDPSDSPPGSTRN